MSFVTKPDYSNNRQIKQFELTNTKLSGTTEFGVHYSGLTGGVDYSSVITTELLENITSTFSGNTTTTSFFFGDTRMDIGVDTLTPITSINSGTTQQGFGFEGVGLVYIDGNPTYSSYTGTTFDLEVISIDEISTDVFTGVTNSTKVSLLSGDSLDFSGRTIWVDVKGITRTKKLILTDEPTIVDDINKALARNSDGEIKQITIGETLYLTGFNYTNQLIGKGTVLSISGGTNGVPNFVPTKAIYNEKYHVIGLAASDILPNDSGLILTKGILSGLSETNYSIGDTIYASPFNAGEYLNSTETFTLSARTHEIGVIINTGNTLGSIYVNIENEDDNLSLSDLERDILEANGLSSGTYEYTGVTKTSDTTFNVPEVKGWIAKNTYEFATKPQVINLTFSGVTGVTTPYLNTDSATYVLIDSNSEILLTPIFPSPQIRRENVFISKIVHPDKTTIQNISNTTDFDVGPMSTIRDLFTPIKLINDGVIISPNGINLSFNKSSGILWGAGINWTINQKDPNSISISGNTPTTFQYKISSGGVFANSTVINPLNYEEGGVVTLIPGNLGSQLIRATNQRVYLFPSGFVTIQYGQEWYNNLSEAVGALKSESFIQYINHKENAILIGVISVSRGCTSLSDDESAIITFTSKFGELLAGTGGLSTTTLQQAYNNATNPEIITNSTLKGVQLQGGTGDDTDPNLLIQNNASEVTGSWLGDGTLSTTTISATTYNNLPQVISFACSDENSDLVVSDNVITLRMPYAMTLIEARASVKIAPTGAPLVVDILLDGVTIFSNRINIDINEKTSVTSILPSIISNAILEDDGEITVNIDAIGTTIAGSGLKVTLKGKLL
mgnify:CR=1 FL=1